MGKIIIDEEFADLLPALDMETYAMLEENLTQNGCHNPITLWNDIIIDGHNRYEICTKYDIPFNTVEKEFSSREDALIWIISTQISRRNLSSIQLSYFRGLHYNADKKIKGTNNQSAQKSESGHNEYITDRTVKRLSDQYRVSSKTLQRDAKLADAITAIGEASPEAKRIILSGDVKLDKKELEALAAMPKDEIAQVAARIEAGTYEKAKPSAIEPPDDGLSSEASGHPPTSSTTSSATTAPLAKNNTEEADFKGYALGQTLPSEADDGISMPHRRAETLLLQALQAALEATIKSGSIALSDGFRVELQEIISVIESSGLSAALRAYIDLLEDVRSQIV